MKKTILLIINIGLIFGGLVLFNYSVILRSRGERIIENAEIDKNEVLKRQELLRNSISDVEDQIKEEQKNIAPKYYYYKHIIDFYDTFNHESTDVAEHIMDIYLNHLKKRPGDYEYKNKRFKSWYTYLIDTTGKQIMKNLQNGELTTLYHNEYSPELIKYLLKLIAKKRDYGELEILISQLLGAYEDIITTEEYESKLNHAYTRLKGWSNKSEVEEIVAAFCDYCEYEEIELTKHYNKHWIYTFWIRRYKEGDIEKIYQILKDIQVYI